MPSWAYPGSGEGRDLRLDLLRGACIAKMVFDHLWGTRLHAVQQWLGHVTAAEGFFFISGAVVGLVHGRRAGEHGLAATSRALLARARDLYLVNLALVFLFLALEAAGHLGERRFPYLHEPRVWPWLFSFDQPYFLHVLPRYVAFLAVAPLAVWCLRRGSTLLLLGVSGGLWLLQQAAGGELRVPVVESAGGPGFPLLSWQLLFFAGMALGYHREPAARLARALVAPAAMAALAAGSLAFALHGRATVLARAVAQPGELAYALFDRDLLGPGRLLNLALVFSLAFALTDRLWHFVSRWAGPLLLPLGRRALAVFLLHIPVVWLAVMRHPAAPLTALVLDAAVLALLWWLARRPALIGWVPN
jgi:hypothetical protein